MDPSIINVSETSNAYTRVEGPRGVAYVKNSSLEFHNYSNQYSSIQPQNFTVTATNGSSVDIDLTSCISSRVRRIWLEVELRNSSLVSAIHPVPLPFMLNQSSAVQLLVNNQSAESMGQYDIWSWLLMQDFDYVAGQTKGMGFEFAGANDYNVVADSVGIPINSSRKYTMELNIGALKQIYFPIVATNNVKLKIVFNAGATLLTAADIALLPSLSFVGLNVYTAGQKYAPAIESRITKQYREADHYCRVVCNRQLQLNLGPVTSGTYLTQILGALTGSQIKMSLMLVNTGAVSEDVFAFDPLTSVSLYDAGGRLYSFNDQSGSLISQQYAVCELDSLQSAFNNVYTLSFCKDVKSTVWNQSSSGSLYFNGKNKIVFKVGATVAGGEDMFISTLEEKILVQFKNGSIQLFELSNNDN